MQQLAPSVWAHVIEAEGFPTLTAVVLTARRAVVVDTLTGPDEMAPVLEFLAAEAGDRRRLVVNTHHHWDHVFGNAAFAGVDIVAQRACPRLIQAELQGGDESRRLSPPEGVPLPTITFGDRLTYADADQTVHLIHTPGHSEDSLVVFLTESRLLLGGDTVEWPLPNFCQRDGRDGVGAHAAPAQAAAGRPGRAGARPGDGQAHHRRQRALRARRLRGGRGRQGLRRRPR